MHVVLLNAQLSTLRGKKSDAELASLELAGRVTSEALHAAIAAAEPGITEAETQATIESVFRQRCNAAPAFASIVAAGEHAAIPHYFNNSGMATAGDVLLMDVGAECGHYAGDMTRTIPVSGRFTDRQRAIYEVVLDAELAAERQAKLGVSAGLMHDSSSVVLARGLFQLGLIEGLDATYDCGITMKCPQWRMYYIHGIGHGIGLEVHEADQFETPPYLLQPGSAFTIEPGVYIPRDLFERLPATEANKRMRERLEPAVRGYSWNRCSNRGQLRQHG
jgi:Xaa-Pro aminopeptidase